MSEKETTVKGIVKSLGLVFGDIGTSPIYTVTVVFLLLEPTHDNILGVLSLIVWTLVILVFLQFDWLAMSLSRRGEGGKIVLKEILVSLLKDKKETALITILTYVGVSLLMGDGVLTPAISILSAVEGAVLIPGLENMSRTTIVFIAGLIAVVLFSFQSRGTEKVAGAFGPVTGVWFAALFVVGAAGISEAPDVLRAFNPAWGVKFLLHNGMVGFFALGEIILCATGGEALYADMGHLGARPIRQAWIGVFVILVVNYLGQGAFLLRHPESKNILFEMVFHYARISYVPFLLLSISATVIASQAMISGMFSMVYQGIATRIMPMFKVDYTSEERKSQIYIGSVNWALLCAVLFIMVEFRESSRLASAYGLAVTATMVITGIFMIWIFHLRKKPLLVLLVLFITLVDAVYLISNIYKIPHGGYWSLILAALPLSLIILFTRGQKRLYRTMDFMALEDFLIKFRRVYETGEKVSGTALFLIKDVRMIPYYITQTMFFHGILYQDNIFVSIVNREDPFGVTGFFREDLAKGLRVFEIQMGYMEVVDVEEILREGGIEERAVFYGLEDIDTANPVWRIFRFIKKNTPPFINVYKIPARKLHGVLTKVRM